MSIFNLKNWTTSKHSFFVKKYVEAMGFTHYNNRDPYMWWDVEDLLAAPSQDWQNFIISDPSLSNVLKEAKFWRDKDLHWAQLEYRIPPEIASKLIRTYIGYHPSYGGYLCQIGPYRSMGAGFGVEHVVKEAIDKFHYYIWRKKKSSADEIAESLANNIEKYQTAFGVSFTPDDFALVYRPPEPYDPSRAGADPSKKGRQKRRQVKDYVPSLDPANPAAQKYFHTNPMLTEGTIITINPNGYAKLLNDLMGPWYKKIIMEKAAAEGKEPNVIAQDIKTNMDLLEEIYNKTYAKWQEAATKGEAAAIGMPPPPKFKDKSLSSTSGERWWRTIPTNEQMVNQMSLRMDIFKALQTGIFTAKEIADILNADPKRQEANLKKKKLGKESLLISEGEVQNILDKINKERQEKNKEISQIAQENEEAIKLMASGRGYDDLKTAFEMCAIYFSSQPLDPSTHAKLGTANIVIFNPPKDFQNFTSEDLKKFREKKVEFETIEKQKIEKTTPEKMIEDIGAEMPEPEKVPGTKKPSKKKQKEVVEPPKPEEQPAEGIPAEDISKMKELFGNTIDNLIKIAEDLDNNGKYNDAEEVHKIIRKYEERMS